ncbi:cysteine--tRNA ligase [Helicobacter cinaedi]|uniref:cysteine--tRNA ligase n=1 Tax=Helicobacter cinaedi TaxID=213 RepID=UPI00155A0974|nr:cysteine--tRNA ligase [Helicobacter cinaedi]
MTLFDSIKKQKLKFEPISPKQVRIYVCGPTVYDDAHLGHARSSIAFDLWRRLFLFLDFKVIFAKNFTDIDDKIIKKSLQNGISVEEVSERYIELYLNDMHALGILRPDLEPKATSNLPQMHEMIEQLLQKGYAYKGENNDVYLSIAKDKAYGSLSQRTTHEQNQSRITNANDKQEESDFALWKGYKGEDDIAYDSPFGKGRPGWHIECSAMIEKHLAYDMREKQEYEKQEFAIDIHAGGADLLFPHHENEASQTRCATGRELAKYWLHNGFVNINGEKMSKSLGNSFFIKDALKVYDGEILRNYLLGVHYRLALNFNEEDLLQSKKRLDKIYRLKKRIMAERIADSIPPTKALDSTELADQLESLNTLKTHTKNAQDSFIKPLLEALSDDYNISKALSIIEEMLSISNDYLDKNPKDKAYKLAISGNLACIEYLLGLGDKDPTLYFQLGLTEQERQDIESKLQARTEAKKQKNYVLADSIRDELKSQGIEIMDTPQGSTWEKI